MKYYIVDAFTDRPFYGNPAAVCIMDSWLDDETMIKIAIENNLSETAFAVKDNSEGADYKLRWFTPGGEIDLCGHATLATSYVIDHFYEPIDGVLKFSTLSGILAIEKDGDIYNMDLPCRPGAPAPLVDTMAKVFGAMPKDAVMARDLLLLFDSPEQIKNMQPDFSLMMELDGLVCIVTAAGGDGCDFSSRSFCPKLNVNEDPVCGSAHSTLIPYWAEKLGKSEMVSKQLGRRLGTLYCKNVGERVIVGGTAALYASGDFNIK